MATTQSSGQPLDQPAAATWLEPDELFHSLQNERRRRVLRILDDARDETFTMGDVAVCIAAAENECPEQEVTSDQRKRVYVALYQHHLPQLDEVGLIEYEQNRGRVEAGPALEQATAFLEMTESADAHDEFEDGPRATASEDDASDSWRPDRMWLGASGGAAAVGLFASGAAWGGVLRASKVLAAVSLVVIVAVVLILAVARL